jgi:AcrR family transcriptional regulator
MRRKDPLPTSTRAPSGDATRDALVSAARDLFGTTGYAGTPVEAIVRAAGLTKGAFYHHFESKQEIFLQVFEDVKRELSRAAFVTHLSSGEPEAEAIPSPEQSDSEIWDDLLARCRRYIELHVEPSVRRIVLLDARAVLPQDDWRKVEHEHGVVLIRADLRRLTHRHVIRPVPLPPLARLLAGALDEACMLVAEADDPPTALDEAMGVIEVLLEGLRQPA